MIEVANLVAEASDGRREVVVAALLRDVVEDQDVTIEKVAALFGLEVASIVSEVSDDKSLPKQVRKEKQVSAPITRARMPPSSSSPTRPATYALSQKVRRHGPSIGSEPTSSGQGSRVGPAVQTSWTVGEVRRCRQNGARKYRPKRLTRGIAANGLVRTVPLEPDAALELRCRIVAETHELAEDPILGFYPQAFCTEA